MDRQRFDIVKRQAGWVIGTGAHTVPGYMIRSAAVRDALKLSAEARAAGCVVEVYVWDGAEATRLDPGEPNTGAWPDTRTRL